jgi:hypothetical protein
MRWQPSGPYGLISEPYRIGRFTVDEGALCTLYGLFLNNETIGYYNDLDEAKEAAECSSQINVRCAAK